MSGPRLPIVTAGSDAQMGASFDGEGVNFAVFSAHAEKIELCLFDAETTEEIARLTLPEKSGDIWHGYVPGLTPGTLYGYRVHGPFAPEKGHRFNHHKLLIDPYTRRLAGPLKPGRALYGYNGRGKDRDLSFNTRDSAPLMPKSVVPEPTSPPSLAPGPNHDWGDMLIYEAHVKGLTMEHPGVPKELRGTYEGLGSDAVIEHLTKLGVTAIELLPVHAFVDEGFLLERGLVNYWGYNSIAFFALAPRYFGPNGEAGFRAAVERLHAAGIEVIMDVVYNHTAEGNEFGPTLCFRGLDNASYYTLPAENPRHYANDTGTGNTFNVRHPQVLRLIIDSLRYWVVEMGIDGFRFDLATTLGREKNGFDPHAGFFDALRQAPMLRGVKLIAEPWDIGPGGYQAGAFPYPFAEWNDSARDNIRRFWRGDAGTAAGLAQTLMGSAQRFDHHGRRAWSAVNYVTAHDGFTLRDVVSYNHKHNEANGEDNQDGHNGATSDNCGAEGPTGDVFILTRRALRQRNMLASLLLSQGTPMLLAGDEIGNSQGGNNNAYCQDNEIGWVNWGKADEAFLAFAHRLTAFRRAHPALGQSRFLHGQINPHTNRPDVAWSRFDGHVPDWENGAFRAFVLSFGMAADTPDYAHTDDWLFVAINGQERDDIVAMPTPPSGYGWLRSIDTTDPEDGGETMVIGGFQLILAQSIVVFALAERSAPPGLHERYGIP